MAGGNDQAAGDEICEELIVISDIVEEEQEIQENQQLMKQIISTMNENADDRYPCWEELEEILGYKFNNRLLLVEAFIHGSLFYPEEPRLSYNRLELIGDSVLNLLVLEKELYFTYPSFASGKLTRLRSANVDNERLARAGVKHELYKFLRHRNHFLDEQLVKFKKSMKKWPDTIGVIDVPKYLADIVESSIGAVYLDCISSIDRRISSIDRLDTAWKVVLKLLEPMINPLTMKIHPATELGEFCSKRKLKFKFFNYYHIDNSTNRVYNRVEVHLNETEIIGTWRSKARKELVQNRAAKVALDYLKEHYA